MSLFKPVENHPEEICCTECWQRGIAWGSAGREEEIIKFLEIEAVRHEQLLLNASADYLLGIIDFIKGENK